MKTLLALAVLVLGSRIADAEILSATFTTVASPYQVNLSDSTAFALWGTGNNGSTTANVVGGQVGLISSSLQDFSNGNPTAGRGYASPPFWNYLVDGDQLYGAIHHLTNSYSPIDEGFNLYLTPDSQQTDYMVWVRASGGTGLVTVFDPSTEDFREVRSLSTNEYGFLSISATGGALVVGLRSTSGVAEYNGANVLLGGVTANVVVVPEPEYWLAGIILLAGAAMYWMIVYGTVLFVGKSDGDERP